MPRKANYIKENMHVRPTRVFYEAMRGLDWKQPIVIIGRKKGTSELYVASTDSGQFANALMAKAMNFLKLGYEKNAPTNTGTRGRSEAVTETTSR